MTNRCRIIFHPADLLSLMIAAADGRIPPDAELREFLQHPHLSRIVALVARSSHWDTPAILQFRYGHSAALTHTTGDPDPAWAPIDPPKSNAS